MVNKVDELLAMEQELETIRQKHDQAFKVYRDTSIEDPTWNDKLLELNKAGAELKEKIGQVREALAKRKGFSSYEDMVNSQPLTSRAW